MKRLMALVGFSYLIALTAAVLMPVDALFYASTALVFLFIVSIIIKKIRNNKVLPVAFLTASIALLVYTVNLYINIQPVKNLQDRDLTVTGYICELPYKKDGRYHYIFKILNVEGEDSPKNFRIKISSSNAVEADIFDLFTGQIHILSQTEVPPFFPQRLGVSKGICVNAFLYDYKPNHTEILKGPKPLYYYALIMRRKMLSAARVFFPQEQASIINGILLGDKNSMSEEIKNSFNVIGVYHLLTVSGVHVSIIAHFIMSVLTKIRVPKRKAALASAVAVIIFMAVTCFTPSVIRAGAMSIIYFLGIALFRQIDSLNSLGIAVFLILLFDPMASGDIRLWLSFLSVLGIIVESSYIEQSIKTYIFRILYGKNFQSHLNESSNCYIFPNKSYMNQILNTVLKYILSTVAMTISVTIFTLPAVIWFFRGLSLISIISNLLMLFPVTLMLTFSLILSLLYVICTPIFIVMPIAFVVGCLANYILFCAKTLSKVPFAWISTDYTFINLWTCFTMILVCIGIISGTLRKRIKLILLISLNLLFLGIFSYQLLMRNVTRVSVINSIEGCSIVLSMNGHHAGIFYGNEKTCINSIERYFCSINATEIDYLFIPKTTEKHIDLIWKLARKYEIDTLVVPATNNNDQSLPMHQLCSDPIEFRSTVDSELWGNVHITSRTINDKIWVKINVSGVNILICCEGGNINDLPGDFRNCNIFIAGGMPINYKNINPAYTVLSMGRKTNDDNALKLLAQNMAVLKSSGYKAVYFDINSSGEIAVRGKM